MVIKILIAAVVVIAGFLVYVAMQPSEFKISREIRINASAEAIFPHANSSKKMAAWNPWMKVDPQMKSEFSGPEEGVGATTTWDGNKEVGAGTATVIESQAPNLVRTRLAYKKPFTSESIAEVSLRSEDSQTVVTWSNSGKTPFVMKVMCALFFNMDKMIGGIFEKGLTDLKTIVESQATAAPATK